MLNGVSIFRYPAHGDFFVLRRIGAIDGHYASYCMRTREFIDIVDGSTFGAKMPRASWDFMGNLPQLLPPLPEQHTIAAFLHRETARIDGLIAKKKRQIELLQKKRTALISQAVMMKGSFYRKAKMKDLADWPGKVPAHWEIKRLKYLVSLKSGENIISEQIEETGEFPVYGGNGLRGFFNRYTHDGNFVLIGRQGALCGNINYGSGKFWASEHAVVAKPIKPIATFWLGELLRIMNLNQYSGSSCATWHRR